MADQRDIDVLTKALGVGGGDNSPASFIRKKMDEDQKNRNDPAREITGMPPNFGQNIIPHVLTFQGLFGTFSKVYRASDEALKKSLEEARWMRNDPLIMECIEARQRMTALLEWRIEPEDKKSEDEKELCRKLEQIVRRIKRFTEYRFNLLHAIWFGRYAIQHSWQWRRVAGVNRLLPTPMGQEDNGWAPVHGDKLVFRFDDGTGDHRPNQLGIRVGGRYGHTNRLNDDEWTERIEPTDRGPAYFLSDYERDLLAVHKHTIEDGAYEDGLDAGTIHGVGIRSRIYWAWFQKQEAVAFLMEYLERSAGGIEIWRYPMGNKKARDEMETAAKERISNQHNIVFVPQSIGEDGSPYGVEVVEPGMAGIEALKDIAEKYFGHQIKRYILGQVLSSEAEATGLGSGVADLHMDTLLQIIKYDATNLQETIENELIRRIKEWNFPAAKDIHPRFVIEVDKPDVKDRMEAFMGAYEIGCKLKASEVMALINASVPDEGDEVLQNPAFTAQPGDPMHPNGAPNRTSFSFPNTGDHVRELSEKLGVMPGDGAPGDISTFHQNGKETQKRIPFGDTGERVRFARRRWRRRAVAAGSI